MRVSIRLLAGLTVLLGLTSTIARAQVEVRMQVGASGYMFGGEDGLDVNPVYAFAGGVGLAVPIGNSVFVRPELTYVVQGGKMDGTVRNVPVDATFSMTYLEVPVLLTWRVRPNGISPEFGIGPALGINIDSRWQFDPGRGAIGEESMERRSSRAIVFAADLVIPVGSQRITTGFRGWYAVKDAGLEDTIPGRESLRSRGVTFLTGILF